MSRGPSIPGPLRHPVVDFLGWVLVAGLALVVGALFVHGCARAQCPACAPLVVCDEWPPPEYPSASPSSSAAWEVPDAAPSGSAEP